MQKPETFVPKSIKIASAGLGLLITLLAGNTANAQDQFFGPNGGVANGGSYSWDDANWTPNLTTGSSSGNVAPYTSTWVQGNFARFYNGGSDSYTIIVNADELNTGIYYDATGTLTINAAGSGDLDVSPTGGPIQGFLVASGGSMIINSAIVGTGGVAPELSGSLSLFGINTYSGGTALGDSGNTLTYFNNSSSFGTGGITLNRTGIGNFSTLLSTGGSPITIGNNFSTVPASTGSGTGLNFANGANTAVNSTGSWTLGSVNLALRNNGNSTAPLTLSGAISGTGNIIFSGANGGTTYISGSSANNSGFTGTATIGGGSGENAITVALGAANTLSSITGMSLAGGTLNLGGFNQTMTSAALGMTASSTIDFTPGGSSAYFANSSLSAWSGTLDLVNWNSSLDTLNFASGAGLTSAQLNDIEFNGGPTGLAEILANGNIAEVPEPSTIFLGLVGGLAVIWQARRRIA